MNLTADGKRGITGSAERGIVSFLSVPDSSSTVEGIFLERRSLLSFNFQIFFSLCFEVECTDLYYFGLVVLFEVLEADLGMLMAILISSSTIRA